MNRIQSRRHNVGYVYNPYVNNDIGIVNYQRQTGDAPLMNPINGSSYEKQ